MGTVEKLTLENMSVAFGILSLGGTETMIHLGGHLLPPPNCNVRLKKYHCNTRVKLEWILRLRYWRFQVVGCHCSQRARVFWQLYK